MTEKIGIIGNGGQADEARSFSDKEIAFRAVDAAYLDDQDPGLVDIANPGQDNETTPVHVAIGPPALRRELESRWPGERYETIVSPHAIIDRTVEIGEGTLVAPRAVITTNVKIGKHVIVNVAATIQHDSSVGDFSTIGPGVNVGGKVKIGEGVFVGIGANIINNITIADGVVVGAGATVVDNADVENGVYVGTPARLIRQNDGWLIEI